MSDIRNTRIENPNVRAYLYKRIPQEFNNNPLFVNVFGKDFVRKRLKSNVLAVYTNEQIGRLRANGYQQISDKSIVLCKSGPERALLTPEDIENDPQLKELSLHECIHAILTRTKEECAKLNIVSGTGLLKTFKSIEDGKYYEIGRGLNEGYTEWLCEKLGHKTYAYGTLTNFVRLLETARGTESIMALGTGNLIEALDMPIEDVNTLLSIADSIYNTEDKINLYNDMAYAMNSDNEYLSDEEINRKKQLRYEYGSEIESLRGDVAFLSWAKDNHKDISDDSLIEYIDNVTIPNLHESRDLLSVRFESLVIERYFLQDLNTVFEEEIISEENLNKVEKIVNLLESNNISSKSQDLCDGMTAVITARKFKDLKVRFIKQMAKEEAEKYNNDDLSLRAFVSKAKNCIGNSNEYREILMDTLINSVDIRHKDALRDTISAALDAHDDSTLFKNISEAEIYSINGIDKYGEEVISSAVYTPGHLFDKYESEQTLDRHSEEKFRFDYTANSGEDLQKVVRQFEKLRAQIFMEHPNATIHVAQRTIVVDTGKTPIFYSVVDDEIIPMEITKREKMHCAPDKEEKKQDKALVPVNIKANTFSNLITKVKRKWHKFRTRKDRQMPANYLGETPGKISFHSDKKDSKNSKDFLSSIKINNPIDKFVINKHNNKKTNNDISNQKENKEINEDNER